MARPHASALMDTKPNMTAWASDVADTGFRGRPPYSHSGYSLARDDASLTYSPNGASVRVLLGPFERGLAPLANFGEVPYYGNLKMPKLASTTSVLREFWICCSSRYELLLRCVAALVKDY